MHLSVATNFDPKLIHKLKEYPVSEIFGALSESVVGALRPTYSLPSIDREKLEREVKEAHQNGISFNYILNTTCSGNVEFSKNGISRIRSMISWLDDIGVDCITVSIPFLLEFIKHNFPRFKVRVSLSNYVDSLQKAKFYEDLGADSITLDFHQNRNFKLIRLLTQYLKAELTLLVNDVCLWGCPYRYYHGNSISHASQEYRGYFVNYCAFHCAQKKARSPEEIMKSRWVRPEDIPFYENLGVSSFKIGGREKPSSYIIRAVSSYSDHRYEGNLYDVLNTIEMNTSPKIQSNFKEKIIFLLRKYMDHLPKIGLKSMVMGSRFLPTLDNKNFSTMLSRMPADHLKKTLKVYINAARPVIDNSLLDGFIGQFDRIDCVNENCDRCGYCKGWADRVITYDENERKNYLSILEDILENIRSGKYAGY